MSVYNFDNAVASLKDGAKPLNEEALRETRVFAKLMLPAGSKYDSIQSPNDFMLSESGEFIRAEMFIVNKRGTMVTDHRTFVNVRKDAKIQRIAKQKLFFVELIHPTLNLAEATDAFAEEAGSTKAPF